MALPPRPGSVPTDRRRTKEGHGGEATADGGAFDLGAIREYKTLPLPLQVSQLRMEEMGSPSYGEELKQVHARRVTLLLSAVKGHGHWDVLQVLRKQHDEEDGPATETCHTQPGSRGRPERGSRTLGRRGRAPARPRSAAQAASCRLWGGGLFPFRRCWWLKRTSGKWWAGVAFPVGGSGIDPAAGATRPGSELALSPRSFCRCCGQTSVAE